MKLAAYRRRARMGMYPILSRESLTKELNSYPEASKDGTSCLLTIAIQLSVQRAARFRAT